MTHRPLHHITISNFRSLAGSIPIPLNAPVVLIHGSNGSGKTSVLSAIELALTGEVQSLARLDDRYMAYIPHFGEPYAAVEIDVLDPAGQQISPGVMTIGASGVEGAAPALLPDQRRFYSERAYLDQVSLGRLLEIYQHTEGSGESSLARFVNELLGLDQLDSLVAGLVDVTHIAKFKKLSSPYAAAVAELDQTQQQFDGATANLSDAESALAGIRLRLNRTLDAMGLSRGEVDEEADLAAISARIAENASSIPLDRLRSLDQMLTALGGRIQGLVSRTLQSSFEEATGRAAEAKASYEAWCADEQPAVVRLREDAASLGIETDGPLKQRLEEELLRLQNQMEEHEHLAAAAAAAATRRAEVSAELETLDAQVAAGESRAGSFATALAALREQVTGDVCPICDRDFSEVSDGGLVAHIDQKVDQLTSQGRTLRVLVDQRDSARTLLESVIHEESQLQQRAFSGDQIAAMDTRRLALTSVLDRLAALADVIERGRDLRAADQQARNEVAELESLGSEQAAIEGLLAEAARELHVDGPLEGETFMETWTRLTASASSALETATMSHRLSIEAQDCVKELRAQLSSADELRLSVATHAKRKRDLERRIAEADRRRIVGRQVRDAASDTRAAVVERVFTEALNRVWRDVFVRLAPDESFVPAFGVPEAGKHTLSLSLETIHRSGESAGAPAAMLSAGNLNTAALSLFVALHLAVEPQVRCLVFDDPVQSMDEVHIAQFAGLLRVLSKQHDRQVVVAVHERELFQYLRLELSPAFDGDELITIELGRGPDHQAPQALATRHKWHPDKAIAV